MKSAGLRRKRGFEGLISVYKYDGLIKKMIEEIKYQHLYEAIESLGQLMSRNLKIDYPKTLGHWQKEKFLLVPIPLHKGREKWRGFNQARELAWVLSKNLDIEYAEILERKKAGINLAKIGNYEQRAKKINGVFELKNKIKESEKIILVDDVITSGATMAEALKTWKQEFPRGQVWGLSLAGARR